jgi:hypothetical protein
LLINWPKLLATNFSPAKTSLTKDSIKLLTSSYSTTFSNDHFNFEADIGKF